MGDVYNYVWDAFNLAWVPEAAGTGGVSIVSVNEVLIDDSAFTVGTSKLFPSGFLADETATDSIDEGDIGIPRITLNRRIITAAQTTDDAAPETGTKITMIGGIADETATDSVDEGDAGWLRITLDRKLIGASNFIDDTAFIVGAGYITAIGALADETGPDSVDEGDVGLLRMTLTRFLKTSMGDLISGENQTTNRMMVEHYYSGTNITSATTTTVLSGAGLFHSIVINKAVATGVITIYDNTAASGTVIGTITFGAALLSDPPIFTLYNRQVSTGITIVTSTATDITVMYRAG